MTNQTNQDNPLNLSPEALAAFQKYSSGTSYTAPNQNWELSSNGRARMQETVRQHGLTREQAQQDPQMLMTATLRALAEQRGQLPINEGVNGRNGLGSSTKAERVGRSLLDMSSLPGADD
ncbi:hypothetical protein AAAW51_004374 [Cronobacter sakazakii]|uniref:hypothetical protein n=1 Tax=Cronobacter sakazakii TaxID=28141 RepID=UPI0009776EAB|nr:hypothetical protein [Cronobacter sakazakii]